MSFQSSPIFHISLSLLLKSAVLFCALSCSYIPKQEEWAYQRLSAGASKPKPKSSLTRKIRDIPFFPVHGKSFRLSELKKALGFVIVMRSVDCPLSETESQALVLMEKVWAQRGVVFLYNYVDFALETKQRAEEEMKNLGLKGAYIWDRRRDLASALMAQTAGDVFVLTPSRQVIYRGPLVARRRRPETQNSLADLTKTVSLTAKNSKGVSCHEARLPHSDCIRRAGLFFPWEGILEAWLSGRSLVPLEWAVVSCPLSRPVFKTDVFYEDAGRVVFQKCTVCHNPQGRGPMDFISYEDVARRGAMFEYVIENGLMPLWHLAPDTGPWRNPLHLTVREKALLLEWAGGGFRRKSAKKDIIQRLWQESQTKPPEDEGGFDYVLRLPEPVNVPSGFQPKMFSDYKTFIISGFKEDRWIKNIKIKPAPKIVHHLTFFVLDPSLSKKELVAIADDHSKIIKKTKAHFFNNIAFPDLHSKGGIFRTGVLFPKGAHFIIKIHYENPGPATIDESTHIKIAFHKKKPERKIVFYSLHNRAVDIPPYDSKYEMLSRFELRHSMSLMAFAPHMHYRGKSADLFVVSPKGKRQKLFSIDPFDVSFRRLYEWRRPVPIEKGSVLECVTRFDNSVKNRQNPDPSKRVQFGPGDDDEMSECYLLFFPPLWIHRSRPALSLFLFRSGSRNQEDISVESEKLP